MKIMAVAFTSLLLLLGLSCSGTSGQRTTAPQGPTEDEAVKKAAEGICVKYEILKDKKIAVFNFANLEGKETAEGSRLSKKLLGELINKGLTLIERTEIDRMLKEQGFQQSGAVDTESISIAGKILPVDVMVSGTIAQISSKGELSVKAVNITTGQIYAITTVEFYPQDRFSYKENQEILKVYKGDPEKLETMNKAYNALTMLSQKNPFLFILASIDEGDIPMIRSVNPDLGMKLKDASDKMQKDRPGDWAKIMKLRKGTRFMKQLAPERYQVILERKKELVKNRPPR